MTEMGTQRQSRTVRQTAAGGFELQDRDFEILEALGKMRFAETNHLAALFFGGSRSAANKRLRKLMNRRLIRTWVRDLAKDNVYSLDRAGSRLLLDDDPEVSLFVAPRGLDGIIDHLLAINDVRTSLALGVSGAGGRLEWFRPEWEIRGRFAERVVPDALFAVAWDACSTRVYSLEVDNHTRSPRAFIRKVLGYEAVAHRGGFYGVAAPVVLAVSRDARSAERYRLALKHIGVGGSVWFTTLADVRQHSVLNHIWRSPLDDEQLSLQKLTTWRSSKENLISDSVRSSEEIAG